ncbi:MAG: hypothetical protein AB9866_21485 [Syntrophobacteraceae bacterium]
MGNQEYVLYFTHQCGVGLDPLKHQQNHQGRSLQRRYYRHGCWHGGPDTATRFSNREDAEAIFDKYGHRKAYGCKWLGHCEPCQIVTVEQALLLEQRGDQNVLADVQGLV